MVTCQNSIMSIISSSQTTILLLTFVHCSINRWIQFRNHFYNTHIIVNIHVLLSRNANKKSSFLSRCSPQVGYFTFHHNMINGDVKISNFHNFASTATLGNNTCLQRYTMQQYNHVSIYLLYKSDQLVCDNI